MIVYPGNPAPSIQRYAEIAQNSVNESTITIGSHTVTHVDSKLHIQEDASGTKQLPLDSFYGKCKVFDLSDVPEEIHKKNLDQFQIDSGDIILLKTRNSMLGYECFNYDFVHVKIDAAQYLVEKEVKTLGFDYLSVKKFGGDPEVHEILINNLTLFEGLNLAEVPGGEYIFIGLPLRIECDGAPARVMLIEK
jgi:arylformamidase